MLVLICLCYGAISFSIFLKSFWFAPLPLLRFYSPCGLMKSPTFVLTRPLAPVAYIVFFALYESPIFPIALPLSCLIASLLLIQRLSSSHELTALRASGFSLFDILTPILITAAFSSPRQFLDYF